LTECCFVCRCVAFRCVGLAVSSQCPRSVLAVQLTIILPTGLNQKAYNTFKDVDDKDSDDDYIQPWLDGFVNDMGEEKAKGLLEGVGVVG